MARRLGMPRFRTTPIRPTEAMASHHNGPDYSPYYGAPVEPMFTADEREQMERARDAVRQNEHPKAFDLPNRSREANLAYIQELYEKLSYDEDNYVPGQFK